MSARRNSCRYSAVAIRPLKARCRTRSCFTGWAICADESLFRTGTIDTRIMERLLGKPENR